MEITRTLSISEDTSPISTVEEFSGAFINKEVWGDGEFVREVVNGKLVSKVAAPNTNDSTGRDDNTGITYRFANNFLNFSDPASINSIQADVSVLDVIHTHPTLSTRAMLAGRWYNDGGAGTQGGGDIWAALSLGATSLPGGLVGLKAHWEVCKETNLAGTTWACIAGGDFTTPDVSMKETYTIYIGYERSNHSFIFRVGIVEIIFDGIPNWDRDADNPLKTLASRVWLQGATESGYISATFDNVYVNGDLVNIYDDFQSGMIDPNKWRTWELVRAVSNGELVSALTQRIGNGANNMNFVNSQAILGFEADLKVVEFQDNGGRPQGRLYATLYNDGTGSSQPSDRTGDVIGIVGVLEQGSGPQAFYAVSKCTAPNCNLPGEYQILYSGIFKNVGLNETHRFSLSWNGFNITLGCDGSEISYNPTPFAPIVGPPKGRKGIGTRVNEIQTADEWAYVAATFDNVVITQMDSDDDGLPDSWEMVKFGNLNQGPSGDPDGDGLTNLREYQLGSNPNNSETNYSLNVTKSGYGTGTVTSSPTGIICGTSCNASYIGATVVTLTAAPNPGFSASWSGCDPPMVPPNVP